MTINLLFNVSTMSNFKLYLSDINPFMQRARHFNTRSSTYNWSVRKLPGENDVLFSSAFQPKTGQNYVLLQS